MQLIDEIEISYFRSFYRFTLRNLKDLNILFGKNDSGKSNVIRALNLFFSKPQEIEQLFDFLVDFNEQRSTEADNKTRNVRKFLYVKVTFNTPKSYQKSLGKKFYVKRQWNVSRGYEYKESIPKIISTSSRRKSVVTRLMNKITFNYIPAIKDHSIFEMLLYGIHETVTQSPIFENAISDFTKEIQGLTSTMFDTLPKEVSDNTKISQPRRLGQLFQSLDFETILSGEIKPKSLIRQRGDGIKARHIPELLNFISENDEYDFHIWGFEEPESSLDIVAQKIEADRLLDLAKSDSVQIFITTHSPSFYIPNNKSVEKCYIIKDQGCQSNSIQGGELEQFDLQQGINEGFYLPALANALAKALEDQNALIQARKKETEAFEELKKEIAKWKEPVVLTEGKIDVKILKVAWKKRRGSADIPFAIKPCEINGEKDGNIGGGASGLARRLKSIADDHMNAIIGLFDRDDAGIKAYGLDKNFSEVDIGGYAVKCGINGKSYAALLPSPDFRRECEEYDNLPIEFLFRDEHLFKEVDGKKLILKRMKTSRKLGKKKVEQKLDDLTHFKEIDKASKKDFAETVVPALDADAFEAFDAVFCMIESIIEYNKTVD